MLKRNFTEDQDSFSVNLANLYKSVACSLYIYQKHKFEMIKSTKPSLLVNFFILIDTPQPLHNKAGLTTIRKLKVNLCSGRVSRSYLEFSVSSRLNHYQRACHNSYCSTIVG